MPGYARRLILPEGEDCFVHTISRCVRRAWLCGDDPLTGKNHDHRRAWVRERIELLSRHFAIQVCAYAVMSNHTHLVLWCRTSVATHWDDAEVLRRWRAVGGHLVDVEDGEDTWTTTTYDAAQVAGWRQRLCSVSWFMRLLNQVIARRANQEDKCRGHFWEARFKSQLLVDEGAVLACMAYVDLNPVRAQAAESLEGSEYTSVRERLAAERGREKIGMIQDHKTQDLRGEDKEHAAAGKEAHADAWLSALDEGGVGGVLGLDLAAYIGLVEWTGRALREGKRGALLPDGLDALERVRLDAENWVESVRRFGRMYAHAVGGEERLRMRARNEGREWVAGVRRGSAMYKQAMA